jgi:hypothetical protein
MPTLSVLTVLTIAWVAVTVVFLSFLFYRSLVGLKQEDIMVLSVGESKLGEEQNQIQSRLQHIQPYLRGFGWASAALLAVIAGIWIYRGVQNLFA